MWKTPATGSQVKKNRPKLKQLATSLLPPIIDSRSTCAGSTGLVQRDAVKDRRSKILTEETYRAAWLRLQSMATTNASPDDGPELLSLTPSERALPDAEIERIRPVMITVAAMILALFPLDELNSACSSYPGMSNMIVLDQGPISQPRHDEGLSGA